MKECKKQALRRKQRIDKILEIIKAASKKKIFIKEKQLVSILCLKWNVSERKIKEYINILLNAGLIEKTLEGLKYKKSKFRLWW